MTPIGPRIILAALVGFVGCPLQGAVGSEDFVQAIRDGKPLLDARLRYEHVSQDGFAKDAEGVILRT